MNSELHKTIIGAGLKLIGFYWVTQKLLSILYYVITNSVISDLLKAISSTPESDHSVGSKIVWWPYTAWYALSIIYGCALIYYSESIADWLCRMAKSQEKPQGNATHAILESEMDESRKQKQKLPVFLLLTTIAFGLFLVVLWLIPNNLRAWAIIVFLLTVIGLMIRNVRKQNTIFRKPPSS